MYGKIQRNKTAHITKINSFETSSILQRQKYINLKSLGVSSKVVSEAQKVFDALGNMTFTGMGEVTAESLVAKIQEAKDAESNLNSLKSQVKEATNQKNGKYKELNDLLKRVKAAVKVQYGDDSNEWEMIGGVRVSERKKRIKKDE